MSVLGRARALLLKGGNFALLAHELHMRRCGHVLRSRGALQVDRLAREGALCAMGVLVPASAVDDLLRDEHVSGIASARFAQPPAALCEGGRGVEKVAKLLGGAVPAPAAVEGTSASEGASTAAAHAEGQGSTASASDAAAASAAAAAAAATATTEPAAATSWQTTSSLARAQRSRLPIAYIKVVAMADSEGVRATPKKNEDFCAARDAGTTSVGVMGSVWDTASSESAAADAAATAAAAASSSSASSASAPTGRVRISFAGRGARGSQGQIAALWRAARLFDLGLAYAMHRSTSRDADEARLLAAVAADDELRFLDEATGAGAAVAVGPFAALSPAELHAVALAAGGSAAAAFSPEAEAAARESQLSLRARDEMLCLTA